MFVISNIIFKANILGVYFVHLSAVSKVRCILVHVGTAGTAPRRKGSAFWNNTEQTDYMYHQHSFKIPVK